MSKLILSLTVLCLTCSQGPGQESLSEKYLYSGQLAQGERVLEAELSTTPEDDQVRFGLAMLQLVRGIERLGSGLYDFGCRPENRQLFVRIPIAENPDPAPITYSSYRRLMSGFRADLATVESTLSRIRNKDVKLSLKLADIHLNLSGGQQPSEQFGEILKKVMGRGFRFHADNPQFLVCFDRGDVAWLRAYCHMLMGLIDLMDSLDGEELFNMTAAEQFIKPKLRTRPSQANQVGPQPPRQIIRITDPVRLRHFRDHMVKVCELNRETWGFIRSETDNDHEWLPNPRQTGVLQLPVTDEMIDSWLLAIQELHDLMLGKKVIPAMIMQWLQPKTAKGFNLARFLEDPPSDIDWPRIQKEGFREKYLDDSRPELGIQAFLRVFQAFQNPIGVGYAVWFN